MFDKGQMRDDVQMEANYDYGSISDADKKIVTEFIKILEDRQGVPAPIIINESPNSSGMLGLFNDWFSGSGNWNNAYSSPWYIIIDDFGFW